MSADEPEIENDAIRYRPKPRPEWAREFIDVGRQIDAKHVVPLDEASLLRAAMENTGLEDFGDDDWREPFRLLIGDLENTAKLHFFGRVMTRSDLLIHLEGRLRVVDWLKRHPEIEEERIEAPVFIIGLPRSGTTIMQEILGADPNARTVRMWEAKYPVPPPSPSDPQPDPRIAKAQGVVGLQDRITPEWATMHKVGAELPVECIEFTYSSFVSYAFSASFYVPNYTRYVAQNDHRGAFAWHKKILQLLQSTGRPPHWLLKGPTHLPVLPMLFETYPDAKLVLMLRDPVKSAASVVDVSGVLYYMRSDDTTLGKGFGKLDRWQAGLPDPAGHDRLDGGRDDSEGSRAAARLSGVLRRSRHEPRQALRGPRAPAPRDVALGHARLRGEQAEGQVRQARLRDR